MLVFEEPVDGGPAIELAASHALLVQAGQGVFDHAIRMYQPRRNAIVFSTSERNNPAFEEAVRVAEGSGFAPAVRVVGGRAVACGVESLVIDIIRRERGDVAAHSGRFETYGRRIASTLSAFGVDARPGAVPGEFCPGNHSVNVGGRVKVVGTAQRVNRNAWMFSMVVIVGGDLDRVRAVLGSVYALMGHDFDPESVGSLAAEVPDLNRVDLRAALRAALIGDHEPVAQRFDQTAMDLATQLLPRHRALEH